MNDTPYEPKPLSKALSDLGEMNEEELKDLGKMTDEERKNVDLRQIKQMQDALHKIANMDMSQWFDDKCHICKWDIVGTMATTGKGKLFGDLHAPDCPFRIAADAFNEDFYTTLQKLISK